jgi:hypothetical protein
MSDHFDTEDARTDLTDLYVFPSSRLADHTVLILDFNPEARADAMSFDPAASYEIKIDTDGDLEADVAFHVLFEGSANDHATATVYRATGARATASGRVGEPIIVGAAVPADGFGEVTAANGYRFFTGLRSDPHFKDVKGFRNNFVGCSCSSRRSSTSGSWPGSPTRWPTPVPLTCRPPRRLRSRRASGRSRRWHGR